MNLTRRSFLGALATISAATSAVGCFVPVGDDGEDDPFDTADGLTAAAGSAGLSLDLKADCGAKGDGRTNDTAAFQDAALRIWAAGGGTLTIPPGTYIVGRQKKKAKKTDPGPFYAAEDIFTIHASEQHPTKKKVIPVSKVQINGYGAIMKVASGLHYGGFDPETGAAKDYTGGKANEAAIGRLIDLLACDNVWVRGLTLDGNLQNLILGGQWGNEDRQASATGIWLGKCLHAAVTDVHTHHHALDGITVWHGGPPPAKTQLHKLTRVVSEYNGRQALSWIGGKGLQCTDCKFNHTGRAVHKGTGKAYMSKPGAGVDIEPNAGTNEKSSDGVFTRCEFVNNRGAGLLSSVGRGGWSSFDDCTFWGTTSYSLYLGHPGLTFTGCRVYGTAMRVGDGHTVDDPDPNPDLATVFVDCDFEDKEWTDGNVHRAGVLYDCPIKYTTGPNGTRISHGNHSAGATWKNCRFVANKVRGVNMPDPDTRENFIGCTFTHRSALKNAGDWQSTFAGSKLTSCHFKESPAFTRSYRIDLDEVVVGKPAAGASATVVDGPRVRWGTANGKTGAIAPGTYST
jgi:hypothetical protein